MKRINYLIQKLASIAPKAGPVALVVVALFATSPMAFAQCSFTWPSPVHVTPGLSFGPAGTLNGISQPQIAIETFTQSGNFNLNNLQVGYNGTTVSAQQTIILPPSPSNVEFSAIVPFSAKTGETAYVTFALYDILGQLLCSASVTVIVDSNCGNPALIQSTFGVQGNFEVVVPYPSGGIAHYYRDNDNGNGNTWYGPTAVFGSGIVDAVSLIESSYGNLEVVARLGSQLAHFYRDSNSLNWSGPTFFGPGVLASGTPSLIQVTNTNFEVVTPLAGGGMAHYTRIGNTWSLVPDVFPSLPTVDTVSLIESDYGNLEVVARIGDQLAHFWRYSSKTWLGPYFFAPGISVSGTPSLIQGRFGTPGNFEVVSSLTTGGMGHFFRDNSSFSSQPWYGPYKFGGDNVRGAALIQGNYGDNLEVVACVASSGLNHYYRFYDNTNNLIWSGPSIIAP